MFRARNIHNLTQKEADRSVETAFKGFDKAQRTENGASYIDVEAAIGVVIWCLDHERKVEIKYLERAKSLIQQLLKNPAIGYYPVENGSKKACKYFDNWRDGNKRKKALRDELKIVNEALKNGGQGKERRAMGLMEKITMTLGE